MRVCIYGAGAIGGYLGVQLALAGADVTLIARGANLAAMQANGVRLRIEGEERVAHPLCTDDPAQVGEQDVVILAVKAPAVSAIVDLMQPLLGAETAVVTAQNGVPWWYFYGQAGPWENKQLQSVDPGGKIWQGIGPQRAIGCVVYPAAELAAPGIIAHISGNRFSLGEPDGTKSARVAAVERAHAGGRSESAAARPHPK